jgi:GNAT superfamily N-acetyltransferase
VKLTRQPTSDAAKRAWSLHATRGARPGSGGTGRGDLRDDEHRDGQNQVLRAPTQASTATRPRRNTARLGLEHKAQLSQLLLSLDRPSRINRFGHPANDACVIAYAKDAVEKALFIAGTFSDDWLVGVAEVFQTGSDDMVEVAFAVHGDCRRRGHCSALLQDAQQWAARSGIKTLRMVISRNNWPTRQLANKMGARVDLDLDEIRADLYVAAGPLSNGARPLSGEALRDVA